MARRVESPARFVSGTLLRRSTGRLRRHVRVRRRTTGLSTNHADAACRYTRCVESSRKPFLVGVPVIFVDTPVCLVDPLPVRRNTPVCLVEARDASCQRATSSHHHTGVLRHPTSVCFVDTPVCFARHAAVSTIHRPLASSTRWGRIARRMPGPLRQTRGCSSSIEPRVVSSASCVVSTDSRVSSLPRVSMNVPKKIVVAVIVNPASLSISKR